MPFQEGCAYGLSREPRDDVFEIRFNEPLPLRIRFPANTVWETTLEIRYEALTDTLPSNRRLWSSMDQHGVFCIAPLEDFFILQGRKGAELMKRVPPDRRFATISSRQYEMALAMEKGSHISVIVKDLDPKQPGNPLKDLKFGVVDSIHEGVISVKHQTGRSCVSATYSMNKVREHPLHPLIRPPPELRNLLEDNAFAMKHNLRRGDRLVVFLQDRPVCGRLEWVGHLSKSDILEAVLVTDEVMRMPHMLFYKYYQLVRVKDLDRVLRVPLSQAMKEEHMESKNEAVVQPLTVNGLSSPQPSDNFDGTDNLDPLEIGSVVLGSSFRGVIRWIGISANDNQYYAGVETDEWQGHKYEDEFEGQHLFHCERGYSRFVPLSELIRDNRFIESNTRQEISLMPTKPPLESSEDDDDDDDEDDTYEPQIPVVAPQRNVAHSSPVVSPHRVNATQTNALNLYRSINKPPIVSRDLLTNVIDKVEQHDMNRNGEIMRVGRGRGKIGSPREDISVGRAPVATPRKTIERNRVLWRKDDLVRIREPTKSNEARTIGHIRWIGESKDRVPMLGLELLAPDPKATGGVFEGELRFRPKSAKCCIFVRESDVIEAGDDDRLVVELAMLNGAQMPYEKTQSNQRDFGHSPTPDITGTVAPVPSSEMHRVVGRSRGIQGNCNSCYLDSILFSLFTFSSAMDSVLYRPPTSNDIDQFSEVQRILREGIVNPLRRRHFVRADKVMKLRELLGRLVHKDDMRYSQKDIEELFFILMERTLRVEPLIRLSSGEQTNIYQLFLESKEGLPAVPETQTLLELSLACSGVKFCEEPSVLLMLMPRHSADEQLFHKVIPSVELDLSCCVEGYPHSCYNCGRPAEMECPSCIYDIGNVPSMQVAFQCRSCCKKLHIREREHRPEAYSVNDEFRHMRQKMPLRLRLVAIICIRSQHYVSFVRCGEDETSPWVFFDSMAERIEGSHYLPVVQTVNVNQWLEAAQQSMNSKRDRIRADLNVSSVVNDPGKIDIAERLFGDGYMCVYHSSEASLYR